MKNEFTVSLTYQELTQVLAALRDWQENYTDRHSNEYFRSRFEHFSEVDPLSLDEIDRLCEKINVDY